MRAGVRQQLVVVAAVVSVAAGSVVAVAQAQQAASQKSDRFVIIRVTLAWSGFAWDGTFVSTSASGRIVDRGRAVDHHEWNGVDLSISRTLTGKAGTMAFRILGRYRQNSPRAALTWTLISGTGAYRGLSGTGRDVEDLTRTRASGEMSAVPAH
jgi:hypothetical protein